jgi:pyruvate formate-lyase/glycerol dehydratase family glycyl radical enzyme
MVTFVNHELSQKVRLEAEELLAAPGRIDIQRIKFLLEVYNETEGMPPVIRRAKLFDKLCSEKSIFIDGNPIVGTLTRFKYGGYPFPEIGCRWMKKVEKFTLQRKEATTTDEDWQWIDKAIAYWRDRNIFNRTQNIMLETRGVDIGTLQKCGIGTELVPGGFISIVPDYSWVLNKGLRGIMAEIMAERAKLDMGSFEDLNKWYWYNGALICLNGMIKLAQRYASLAREMAKKEGPGERKRELERIAETCEWVPANPARSFPEAIQSVWFTILGAWLDSPTVLNSSAELFPQYMYSFYKKDKREGKLTDEEAIELIQFLFLKINGLAQPLAPHGVGFSSSRIGNQLGIGGLTADGGDATNELDFLVLEAQYRIRLPEPLIYIIYHDKLPEQLLMKCVDLIRTGIGQPAFHSAQKIVQQNLHYFKDMSVEEARHIGIMGCVQNIVPGYIDGYWEGQLNTAKMVELVLNNGKDPLTGIQIGPEIGKAEALQSYDDFYEAVIKQLQYFIPLVREIGRLVWNIERDFPVPFGSALTHDCIKKGKDLLDGGARYTMANGGDFITIIDLANSLAAVKKLVYEERKISMKELKKALAEDFEGYEDIRRLCLHAPKYGNDDDYTDSIAKQLYELCLKEHQKFPDFLGRTAKPMAYSVTGHVAVGRFTGALPSGRKARIPLTDASCSAMPGTDKSGPTSLIKSSTKVIDTIKFGNNHFNMKFHPTALKGPEGARKFLSMIKTYMDLGGYHVQFNCVSSEVLRDAQLNPENYRNLVVRVAGFSAFFITLDKLVQDEIISRSQLSLT